MLLLLLPLILNWWHYWLLKKVTVDLLHNLAFLLQYNLQLLELP